MSLDISQLKAAKEATRILRLATEAQKNLFLQKLAEGLIARQSDLLAANALDLAKAGDMPDHMKKRLTLNESVIAGMIDGVKQVIKLKDPVGEVAEQWRASGGLEIQKTRVPIGVIFFVFESRPNVIVDAAALAIKSGNVLIARGGKEAGESNQMNIAIIHDALRAVGLPSTAVMTLDDMSHETIYEALRHPEYIDLAVARGRQQLIDAVKEHARMPVIAHERGLCAVYIDASADYAMAIKIAINAKTSNPAVCNSAETILVHASCADQVLPELIRELSARGVTIKGDARVCSYDKACLLAQDSDWDTEFLSLTVAIKIVSDIDEAIAHIERHGSRHSDAIVTADKTQAKKFVESVNSATVLINASTRLVDGARLGLGAEFGISTASIHMRGPMGLEDLTVTRFVVSGDGQIRE